MSTKLVEENLVAQVVAKLRAQQETIRILRAENEKLRVLYEKALGDVVKEHIENVQLRRDLEFWRERGMG